MHQRENMFAKGTGIVGIIFFVSALAVEYWPTRSSLTWLSFSEAQTAARSSNKPVLVDVYAEWCPPCKQMDRVVFPDDSVKDVLQRRFILAKVNFDDPLWGDSVRKHFQLRAIPTYIVLTPGGREIKRHVGFFEKTAFVNWLQDSSHLLLFSWLSFDKAKVQVEFQEKRLLVLVTGSSEDFDRLSALFDTPETRQIIDSVFIPTVLVRTNKTDEEMITRLGGAKTLLNEVLVLDGDRELGRFVITPDMFYNQNRFLERLYGLSRKPPGPYPRSFIPQQRIRRISLTSTP